MSLQIGSPPKRFQSTWDTTEAGSSNNQVVLPLVSNGDYDFRIDWGDGTSNRDSITAYNQAEVTHTYDSTGIYEIRVIGGVTGWQFNDGGDDDKITEISKWGPLRFVSNDNDLFEGCSNLVLIATDSLTLAASNGLRMFYNCPKLGDQGDMNSWDTSSCTNMGSMFNRATNFNQNISNWNISSVTDINRMFDHAHNFNNGGSTGINNWDTSSCTNMQNMFFNSYIFNQPVSDWDTSSVTLMDGMFYGCTGFNQPISNWDTSKVTNMYRMFTAASSFNQPLDDWDVTGVTSMSSMFNGAEDFNNGGSTGINNWRPSSCTTMDNVFYGATGFNQPIGDWDTSSVTTMQNMFNRATNFNQDISNWNVTGVTTMNRMFDQVAIFNQPIGNWTTSSLTDIVNMLYNGDAFNQDLSNWNVSNITSANGFMNGANGLSTTNYDRTLSGWSSQSVNNGVSIHFGGSQYSTATGAAYRATLVSKGWTITDGGAV
jgi:surface protein